MLVLINQIKISSLGCRLSRSFLINLKIERRKAKSDDDSRRNKIGFGWTGIAMVEWGGIVIGKKHGANLL